jgi:hypothetical protein
MLRPHMAIVHWAKVVGPQVAGAAQAVAIKNGSSLLVRTKSNVWANELSLLKTDILRRINNVLGGDVIKDLRFEIGALSPVAAEAGDVRPSADELDGIHLSHEALARIAKSSSDIADEEMRAAIRHTLTRAGQTDRWKKEHGWILCSVCRTLYEPSGKTKPILCPACRLKSSV